VESAPAASVSAPAASAAIPALTTAQFKDSWNAILSLVEKESKTAWVIAYTLQVMDYTDEVLTLRFASQHDLETFKTSGAAPDILRRAIQTELGVTVKFKPSVPEASSPASPLPSEKTTPIAVVPEVAIVPEVAEEPVAEVAVEPTPEPELAAEPVVEAAPEAPAKAAKPAKATKSRAVDMPADERYGESVVRDLLGGVPLDEPGAGR
jgi:DNA polymerase-3 subunit gamma/tau